MLRLVLTAHLQYLGNVTGFVLVEARRRGIDVAQETRLTLVVEELFVNICRYAYPPERVAGAGGEAGKVAFELAAEGARAKCLHLVIRDSGVPFDPLAINIRPDPQAGLDARRPGGLGIFLVRHLTERQWYRRVSGRNELHVEFPLRNLPGELCA